jgi:membrane-associated phospholipid phosphatase
MEAITRTPDRWAVRIGVAGVVVAVCTLAARDGVPAWEESLFRAVHDLPDWLGLLLWAPMQLGTLFAPGLVAAASWIAWGRWRPTVGAIVAGIVGWWFAQVIKAQVDRGRPHSLLSDLERRAGAPHDGLGFLSGHATVAFALAAVVSPYLTRPQRIAAYALAGTVALARMHVGAHFPLDVVAGAALGYGLGWLWNLAVGVPVAVEETALR